MADDREQREEQRRQELLKLHFEFFKHFTTLGVAAAVVLLAVHREVVAERDLLAFSLVTMGFGVLVAMLGMVLALAWFKEGREVGRLDRTMLVGACSLVVGGLAGFAGEALNTPRWALIAALFVVTAAIVYARFTGRSS